MATQPPHVGTIGDKIRIGHGIWINCLNQECLHRAKVDLAALAELGRLSKNSRERRELYRLCEIVPI
jgi:hypothetical protein